MFSPFIEAAVDSMKRFVVDQTALQAFSASIWMEMDGMGWVGQLLSVLKAQVTHLAYVKQNSNRREKTKRS